MNKLSSTSASTAVATPITRFLRACAAPLYPLIVLAVLWEFLSRSGLVSPRLMPSLVDIGGALMSGVMDGTIPEHALTSLTRALTGFGLAIVIGIVLGVSMARGRLFQYVFEPIFSFGYPIPKIALYPIFILLLGFGSPSKIALICLECTFPIAVNSYFGMKSVPKKYLWASRNMGANRMQIFFKVLIPAAAPTIFSGIRIALPISLVIVTLTEMIGDSSGLGYFISYSAASFKYAMSYAGVISIAAMGFVLDRILIFLRDKVIFWDRSSASHAPPKA